MYADLRSDNANRNEWSEEKKEKKGQVNNC